MSLAANKLTSHSKSPLQHKQLRFSRKEGGLPCSRLPPSVMQNLRVYLLFSHTLVYICYGWHVSAVLPSLFPKNKLFFPFPRPPTIPTTFLDYNRYIEQLSKKFYKVIKMMTVELV